MHHTRSILAAAVFVAGMLAMSPAAAVKPDEPLPGCRLLHLPAGTFTMGDGTGRWSEIQVEVTLTVGFFLGQHEITNGEFLQMVQWAYDNGLVAADSYHVIDLLGDGRTVLVNLDTEWGELAFADGRFALRRAPTAHAGNVYPEGYDPADHPVKDVTWEGSVAFCNWLNLRAGLPPSYDHVTWTCVGDNPYALTGYRLPTDAEWEYAARYPDGRRYPWGTEPCDPSRANYRNSCHGWTTPVGAYPAAPEVDGGGFHDLLGNLWERVHGFHYELSTEPVRDPVGPGAGRWRILRGGAWWYYCDDIRSALRPPFPADYRGGHVGFRIARSDRPGPAPAAPSWK